MAHARVRGAVDAFIALGGNADKTGEISTEKLRSIIKDFGLTIDIDVRAPLPSARATCAWRGSRPPPPDVSTARARSV